MVYLDGGPAPRSTVSAGGAAAAAAAAGAASAAHAATHGPTLAQIVAQRMYDQQHQAQERAAQRGHSFMQNAGATLSASVLRAQANLARQRQQEAQQAAAERAAEGKRILEEKFPYLFGNPNQVELTRANEPWFNVALGIGQNGNGLTQPNGMAGLLGIQGNGPVPAYPNGAGQTSKPGQANAFNAPKLNSSEDAKAAAAEAAAKANQANPEIGPTGKPVNMAMPADADATDPPEVHQYKNLLQQYEQQNEGSLFGGDNGTLLGDGNSGTSTSSSNDGLSVTYSSLAGRGFGYVLIKDPKTGKLTTESVATALEKISATAQRDPTAAAELMTSLAAMGAYAGGSDQYVQDRLYLKGKTLQGTWSKDDITALANGLQMATQEQITQAETPNSSIESIQDIISQLGMRNQNVALTSPGGSIYGNKAAGNSGGGYSSSRSYGGGGGGYYGGGGGGGGSSVTLTDPAVIADQANQTAKGMLGRVLSPQELQEFTAYYHQLEENPNVSLSYASVGIPAEAESWIQQHLQGDYNTQQYANYFDGLIQLFQQGLGNTQ